MSGTGTEKIRVLFVCMGNICRSPTAQGVFEHTLAGTPLAARVDVDSAGTHAYHVGEPPYPRSQAAARRRGIDLSGQRARQVSDEDFEAFDLILAMDLNNFSALRSRCPAPLRDRIRLFLTYIEDSDVLNVPDPYYGDAQTFETVLDLTEAASRGLRDELLARS